MRQGIKAPTLTLKRPLSLRGAGWVFLSGIPPSPPKPKVVNPGWRPGAQARSPIASSFSFFFLLLLGHQNDPEESPQGRRRRLRQRPPRTPRTPRTRTPLRLQHRLLRLRGQRGQPRRIRQRGRRRQRGNFVGFLILVVSFHSLHDYLLVCLWQCGDYRSSRRRRHRREREEAAAVAGRENKAMVDMMEKMQQVTMHAKRIVCWVWLRTYSPCRPWML